MTQTNSVSKQPSSVNTTKSTPVPSSVAREETKNSSGNGGPILDEIKGWEPSQGQFILQDVITNKTYLPIDSWLFHQELTGAPDTILSNPPELPRLLFTSLFCLFFCFVLLC